MSERAFDLGATVTDHVTGQKGTVIEIHHQLPVYVIRAEQGQYVHRVAKQIEYAEAVTETVIGRHHVTCSKCGRIDALPVYNTHRSELHAIDRAGWYFKSSEPMALLCPKCAEGVQFTVGLPDGSRPEAKPEVRSVCLLKEEKR